MKQPAHDAPPRRDLTACRPCRRAKSPLRGIMRAVMLAEFSKVALYAAAVIAGAATLVSWAT